MIVSLIAAMDRNRLIGREGGLPWKLPADLKHFKQTTMGHHLILGRKTYESLAGPLPGREIIVVTRRDGYDASFGRVVGSIDEALDLCQGDDQPFIAGGAEIYRLALPITHRMHLTHVEATFEGDTWFPEWSTDDWDVVTREKHEPDEKNSWPWSFVIYEREGTGYGC